MATGDPPMPWEPNYIGWPAPYQAFAPQPACGNTAWIGNTHPTFGAPRLTDDDVERIARRVEEMRAERGVALPELYAATIAAFIKAGCRGRNAVHALRVRMHLW